MAERYAVDSLQQDWLSFLQDRGHTTKSLPAAKGVIVSKNRKAGSFRWILFTDTGPTKKLQLDERRRLLQHYKQARAQGQRPYVVVHFSTLEPKVVVMPADKIVRSMCIRSDRGGIAWLQ